VLLWWASPRRWLQWLAAIGRGSALLRWMAGAAAERRPALIVGASTSRCRWVAAAHHPPARALQGTTASVYFVPDVFGISIIQGRLQDINGVPVVGCCETPFTGTNRLVKRSATSCWPPPSCC
jgi:hypothetical protein